jgi:hypothetical protein
VWIVADEEFPPPPHVDEGVAAVWRQVVARHEHPERIVGEDLETYCAQVAIARDLRQQIAKDGVWVANRNGEKVPNPLLEANREVLKQIKGWGDRFVPPTKHETAKRRNGYVYEATGKAVASAKHLKGHHEFDGAIAAVRTLAWLIDEAQREGIEAMQKAAFGTIPSYLKGCAELMITPASLPVGMVALGAPVADSDDDDEAGGSVTDLDAWISDQGDGGAAM